MILDKGDFDINILTHYKISYGHEPSGGTGVGSVGLDAKTDRLTAMRC
jgi:hypothetical protein